MRSFPITMLSSFNVMILGKFSVNTICLPFNVIKNIEKRRSTVAGWGYTQIKASRRKYQQVKINEFPLL